MEMRKVQGNEHRRKRTKSERSKAVLPMFVRRPSDEKLFWQTLRRQWLQKTTSLIATPTLQERGTEEKC